MNTRELSGLALRKALCEALGWYVADGLWWMTPEGKPPTIETRHWDSCEQLIAPSAIELLPAFESDPGVFWTAFMQWCKDHPGTYYYVHGFPMDGEHTFSVHWDSCEDGDMGWESEGATICEAGCRAWLQALEAQ